LTGLVEHPAGLVAVAVFYAGYHAVLVLVDARLQERIAGPARATVTSVAALGVEVATFAVYAAWVLGEVSAVAALGVLLAAALPVLLRTDRRPSRSSGRWRIRSSGPTVRH
jgi:hypothetical protein